jgi:hypothetical protein
MSSSTVIQTATGPWQKALAANRSAYAVTANLPGNSAPGFPDGTFDCGIGDVGGPGPNLAEVQVYGTGADDTTGSVRVIGWSKVGTSDATAMWMREVICEVAVILSAAVGLTGRVPSNSERQADSYVKTTGSDNDLSLNSPANDQPGGFMVDLKGHQKFSLDFAVGTATDLNALVRKF